AIAGAAISVLDPAPADLTLDGLTTYLGGINVNSLTTAAIPQTGAVSYLSSIPVVGGVAAGLLNTQLGTIMPAALTTLVNDALALVPSTSLPTLTAGVEVEGIGNLSINGAIHVNTEWGGMDENGDLAGSIAFPPYGMACMPILPTTRVRAREVRIAGGVDN